MTIENDIKEWIEQVSMNRKELNHHPICPFAKNASYVIIECSVENLCLPEKEYDIVIYKIENSLNLETIEKWIKHYNTKYEDWIFFEDCASQDTFINNVQTNNQKHNLIVCQSKKKLKKYREILAKIGYYEHWQENYLKKILQDDYYDIFGIETP